MSISPRIDPARHRMPPTPSHMGMSNRPLFSSLPLRKGDPHHSAWGLWGDDDELGTLNLITEETVRAASTEIKEGLRINLNWTFGEPSHPCFGRQKCQHNV